MNQDARLVDVLRAALDIGFLGTPDIHAHIRHALGFGDVAEAALGASPSRFCDLGSGGGVPALVLLGRWPNSVALLVESSRRRAAFLRTALAELGCESRATVAEARAETVAHLPEQRDIFDVVTARGFAEPAVTAEIGVGLLRVGGILVVSDPPEADPARWPSAGLAELGLGAAHRTAVAGAHYAVIEKVSPTSPKIPRAVGRPGKRPLW